MVIKHSFMQSQHHTETRRQLFKQTAEVFRGKRNQSFPYQIAMKRADLCPKELDFVFICSRSENTSVI